MDNELLLFDRINVIKDVIKKYGEENFYLSFSGGKDSTMLHHLLDEALPNNKIPRVYINTGIEYLDIVNYVKHMKETDDRIVIVNSGVNIPKMLQEFGYHFKSKGHSKKLGEYQRNNITDAIRKYIDGVKDDGSKSKFACPKCLKYQFTDSFELKVSERCCDKLKKEIGHRYENESNRHIPILGVRMGEGGQRENQQECVVFDKNRKKLLKIKPINPVSDDWMNWYINTRKIKLCKLYYPPYNFKRTGCKGCPFAINLQEQLEVMESLLPNERKQCEIIWKPVYEEYRRIGYRLDKNEQIKLF